MLLYMYVHILVCIFFIYLFIVSVCYHLLYGNKYILKRLTFAFLAIYVTQQLVIISLTAAVMIYVSYLTVIIILTGRMPPFGEIC